MKNKKPTKKSVRLSKDVVPSEYDIKLHPDLENFTFGGLETISLNILKPTKTLTLHSKEIDIETADILINKGKVFGKFSYDTKAETVTFTFPKAVAKGKTKLTITFKGILNDKMRGFYKSSYVYEGKVHNIATTQFEATDARRSFPCFDEPAHKAVFHVSLVVPKGKTAISNTLPVSRMEHEAGFEIIRFAPTPKMSTYLLAFIVGDFEYIEKKSKRGVLVRVYTTPGKLHQAKFALDTTVKTLDFYEDYFEIAYPLNTLDMIAIPDFSSLAMENWGAITFREVGLLVDDKNTSLGNKQMVALVIAHELAHQWFGNLVTMEWWTHLWLNEGFASYIEYLAVDKLFPEWDMWTQFAVNDLNFAFKLDALKHTHPIEIPVHHPDEIGEIFDEVSYNKGASIIRMLAEYLGPENFRLGLSHYLKVHSYKNTETEHLWQALEKVSKKPVQKMMSLWTSQSGHPVVHASIQNGALTLSQERFFLSAISKKENKTKTLWQIPLAIGQDSEIKKIVLAERNSSEASQNSFSGQLSSPSRIFLLKNRSVSARQPAKSGAESAPSTNFGYLKLNMGESSFCRIKYSPEMLEALRAPVREKSLPAIDRLGLARDVFALSEAGLMSIDQALEFIESYKNEDSYVVWAEISGGLARLEQIFAKDKKIREHLQKFVISLFSPVFARLGFEKIRGESSFDTLLRSLTLARLGRAGDKKIVAYMKNLYRKLSNGAHIDADIRGAMYGVVASNGSKKEFHKLIAQYKNETLHEEKNRLGNAIGSFKDPKILESVCKFAFSKDVRIQDTTSILSLVAMNPSGRDVFIKFLSKNWAEILERYGQGGHILSRFVKALSHTPEKKHLAWVNTFFKTHPAPGAERSLDQVRERIANNALSLFRDKKLLAKFLKKY